MRFSAFASLLALTVSTTCVIAACSSDDAADTTGDPDAAANGDGNPNGPNPDPDGATSDGAKDGGFDATKKDGDTDTDGAVLDDGGVIPGGDPPAVRLIGRFENDGVGDNVAFPGAKIVARFNGTDATVKLRQTNGFSGGPSYFNVTVDGVQQAAKLVVTGGSTDYPVAVNLAAGAHVVELEKRTESIFGVVRYEGFTFPNGGVLLGPPARLTRRIEFLSDSTVDGFGVEGNLDPAAANYCGPDTPANNYGAPPQFSNARKSMAAVAAAAVNAEGFLIAYSGKGLQKNNDPDDPLVFPALYERALPDVAGSTYAFTLPADAVVISLGGVDFDGLGTEPAGFSAAYGGLVDKVRLHYPGAWIFLTVWSQIKDYGGALNTRTALKGALMSVIAARAADTKLSYFQFPESSGGNLGGADETGCQFHANAGLHASMGALLAAELKSKLGW